MYAKCLLSLLFLLQTVDSFSPENKKGVCVKNIPRQFTKRVSKYESYYETYRETCRLFWTCVRKRGAWRIVYQTVADTRLDTSYVCCAGYQGSVYDECKPKCDFPCIHGYCDEPNKCVCNSGYSKYNSTMCKESCYGDDRSCINGICTKNSYCECLPGFIGVDDRACKSICEEGFTESDYGCDPVCPSGCPNGTCIAPGKCSCDEGYDAVMGTCRPNCKECTNGECIAPNECECFEGYKLNNSTSACIPDCKNECSEEEICSSPDICSCKDGYERIDEHCQATCTRCSNGNCIAPETCWCQTGFENPEGQTDRCTSIICRDGCENGTCVAVDKCICEKGYNYTSGGCYPVCESGCVGGYCIYPDSCSCDTGFENPEGKTDRCSPIICRDGCENGTCVAVDKCICEEGYNYTSGGCYPVCESGCIGGDCIFPDTCSCDTGYENPEGRTDRCSPIICRDGCENGICVAVDKCVCDEGYKFISGACYPSCESGGCNNGICLASGVCRCDDYDKFDHIGISCLPFCSDGCVNGTCIESSRYSLVEVECEKCSGVNCVLNDLLIPTECGENCSKCFNGTWNQDNGCICEYGYILKELQDNNTYCMEMIADSSSEPTLLIASTESIRRGSQTWLYVGVSMSVIFLLLVLSVLFGRRIRRILCGRSYRIWSGAGSASNVVVSDSVSYHGEDVILRTD